MPFRLFSLAEAANYLHLPANRVEELARRGAFPCERQGGRLTFWQHDLDQWASLHVLESRDEKLSDFHQRSTAKYHCVSDDAAIVTTLLKPEWIRTKWACRTKASVLRDMVSLAEATGLVCSREELLTSITEREQLCSTALPGGLALLHPRHHEPYMFGDSFLALGKTVGQIPFGSPDGSTTRLFFLICCQDDRIHLHLLARLCMICQHDALLDSLHSTDDPHELYQHLVEAEQAILQKTAKS